MKTRCVFRAPCSVRRIASTRLKRRAARPGFTILELMVSIGVFAMVLMAIYATWISILKGSRAGLKAAAEVQRSRIAVRTLEAAFSTTEMFVGNMNHYLFFADTSGEMAAVSMAARVPDDFLGANQDGMLDQKVRRVSFYTQQGRDGMAELKMTLAPILAVTNSDYLPYTLTLARDVTQFKLFFFDPQKAEWIDEWKYTNRLPISVQFQLGIGKTANNAGKPYDLVTGLVTLPSVAVPPDVQGGGPVRIPPGAPGFPGAPGVPTAPGLPGGTVPKNPGGAVFR